MKFFKKKENTTKEYNMKLTNEQQPFAHIIELLITKHGWDQIPLKK
tara:strand:+ start:274 stop:411 length:138 start_codon:yes stop_codon:yes gene_type:complete